MDKIEKEIRDVEKQIKVSLQLQFPGWEADVDRLSSILDNLKEEQYKKSHQL